MNCPYCAEEIKDEAVVCRHCGHDFSLVKPMLVRLIALEKDFTGLLATPSPALAEGGPIYAFAALVSVALAVLYTSGYLFLSIAPPLPETALPKILAILLPPLIMGFSAGITWRDRGLKAYLSSGLALGILNFLCIWFIMGSFEDLRFRWAWALLVFVFGQPSTFATAALVGKALRSRWSPPPATRLRPQDKGVNIEKVATQVATVVDSIMKVIGLATCIATTVAGSIKFLGG